MEIGIFVPPGNTGTACNVCVESTVRDALFLKYSGIVLADAVGPAGPPFVDAAALCKIEMLFRWVSKAASFAKASHTSSPAEGPTQVAS